MNRKIQFSNPFTIVLSIASCIVLNIVKKRDSLFKMMICLLPQLDCIVTRNVKDYAKSSVKEVNPAVEYRNKAGGNLLFRPIGIIEFVKASVVIAQRENKDFKYVLQQMNKIELNLNSSIWQGGVWDGKKIINRVNTTLIRFIILELVSKKLLTEVEKKHLIDLYISATNYEGDRARVLNKIV